ncbi:hypothetical protein LguiA_022319 [Lonicera macranthoides]
MCCVWLVINASRYGAKEFLHQNSACGLGAKSLLHQNSVLGGGAKYVLHQVSVLENGCKTCFAPGRVKGKLPCFFTWYK